MGQRRTGIRPCARGLQHLIAAELNAAGKGWPPLVDERTEGGGAPGRTQGPHLPQAEGNRIGRPFRGQFEGHPGAGFAHIPQEGDGDVEIRGREYSQTRRRGRQFRPPALTSHRQCDEPIGHRGRIVDGP